MISPRCRAFVLLATLPYLAACENEAVSMMIDGRNHALVLVREQQYFWRDTVEQSLIASRLPDCQRKVKIRPGRTTMTPLEVYETGEMLWALHQGGQWYLASTEECRVQDWHKPADQSPGQARGRFEMRGGKVVFTPAPSPSPAPQPGA
ncbi:MAG: hypothetical protein LBF61_12285 [Azoarcus sp.]|nr:hypothetical protein [Azoarcus sp.]